MPQPPEPKPPEPKPPAPKPGDRRDDDGGSSFRGHGSFSPLFWWIAFMAVMLIALQWRSKETGRQEVSSWTGFKQLLVDQAIEPDSVTIRHDRVEAVLKPEVVPDESLSIAKEADQPAPLFVAIDSENRQWFIEQIDALQVAYRLDTSVSRWWTILLSWLPMIVLIAFFWFLLYRTRQTFGEGAGGMLGAFGRSQHHVASKDTVSVTLDDVAGIDEAKAEIGEIIEFLQNPGRFQKIGARIPRGVLLLGPPGCGKTLLARAIAGQADVPFFSISGSDFMEMFVGVGARRVRDLFEQAKRSEPCIIFLDEIDSIGRKRGLELIAGGGHGEREQTLNAILSEMDGFEPHDQVIVIAATNRPDVLDPALIRPGRFDRQVDVPLPDSKGRENILRIHTKQVKLADDVDLQELARATPMFSGADLKALVNEAAIIATMSDKSAVTMEDLRRGRDKLKFGRAQTSRKIDAQQRTISAYHEAGHALLESLLPDADPVEKVTIVPRGRALGATFALPERERYTYGRKYILATMRVLCGGRIAELRKTGDAFSGAEDDIKKLTELADRMVRMWGMSEDIGFVRVATDAEEERLLIDRGYSEQTAKQIDDAIQTLVNEAYRDADQMIEQHWSTVEAIAQALLDRETLTADELKQLMQHHSQTALDRSPI
ncbi:ATP-dependent zinc metalloprotease FtsH [Stieleria sp. ICT_E10.1]|uniref:ATP-dependent zinc metalloprotease FtsH n=1 Tax=Stieleria sedimenti TaxID=2976331 RepID=UPI0021806AAE|nr:ATP-dependent zinc metalloprotease FtsH [Stieleria sedimenti]MCS7467910.1 ATP-dependent zinc metalloprotease FtsH [Stieleria sedimenti]